MSLRIDTDLITAVLLADGWHTVAGNSFDLDSYEMRDGDYMTLRGGEADGVTATGFTFKEGDGPHSTTIYGPLTSVLAVKTGKK